MLAERVRVPQAELFGFMADTRNTLARVIERQEEQAKKIEQHDRDIEQLIARAALRSERTLTERVSMLERVQAEHDKRIAALERQRVTE